MVGLLIILGIISLCIFMYVLFNKHSIQREYQATGSSTHYNVCSGYGCCNTTTTGDGSEECSISIPLSNWPPQTTPLIFKIGQPGTAMGEKEQPNGRFGSYSPGCSSYCPTGFESNFTIIPDPTTGCLVQHIKSSGMNGTDNTITLDYTASPESLCVTPVPGNTPGYNKECCNSSPCVTSSGVNLSVNLSDPDCPGSMSMTANNLFNSEKNSVKICMYLRGDGTATQYFGTKVGDGSNHDDWVKACPIK